MTNTHRLTKLVATVALGTALAGLGSIAVIAQADQPIGPPGAQVGPGGPGRGGPLGPGRRFGPGRMGRQGPQGPGGRSGGGFAPGLGGVAGALLGQVRDIAEEHEAEIRPLREQLRTARLALDETVHTAPVNEAAIRERSAAVATAQTDLALAQARMNADIMDSLTPEQRELVQEQRDRARERVADSPRGRRR